jgi:hypothetical protein
MPSSRRVCIRRVELVELSTRRVNNNLTSRQKGCLPKNENTVASFSSHKICLRAPKSKNKSIMKGAFLASIHLLTMSFVAAFVVRNPANMKPTGYYYGFSATTIERDTASLTRKLPGASSMHLFSNRDGQDKLFGTSLSLDAVRVLAVVVTLVASSVQIIDGGQVGIVSQLQGQCPSWTLILI